MSVYRPNEIGSNPYRTERINGDPEEDRDGQRKKKKVSYHGRSWSESEEDLSVQPPMPAFTREERKGRAVYADHETVERAEKLLAGFASIEEKVAQLCFYQTEAFYDAEEQAKLEFLIQKWQIGGLLFSKGEFRRQSYLIECYQRVAKFPLFIGNGFLHGLSFYFQGEIPALEKMNERKLSDLGKAVVSQNRKLGCHFQFDSEMIPDATSRAFRNGIREAGGIVAREKKKNERLVPTLTSKTLAGFMSSQNKLEAHSMRTINFIDLTAECDNFETRIVEAFQGGYDAFLLKNHIDKAVEVLSTQIKLGKLSEAELDRHLIKILIHKMSHFKLN